MEIVKEKMEVMRNKYSPIVHLLQEIRKLID